MTQKTVLVACVGKKATLPRPARDLYTSAWFKKASAYAQQIGDQWFILSAKYGLVSPDQVIASYDETLNRMPVAQRRAWADKVLQVLHHEVHAGDVIIILAGQRYREFLIRPLEARGCQVEMPMRGLRIGEQLRWLNRRLEGQHG
ncbi:MAG: hypothetical protein JXB35_05305 [Anaerolineae bacterium]|nr:hypothetical protein [Anaerolineae bacterium]